jgi:hypothetical protein
MPDYIVNGFENSGYFFNVFYRLFNPFLLFHKPYALASGFLIALPGRERHRIKLRVKYKINSYTIGELRIGGIEYAN